MLRFVRLVHPVALTLAVAGLAGPTAAAAKDFRYVGIPIMGTDVA